MMANLAAHLFAAEAIVTTETKAKLLRPYAEKLITKARKGGLHQPAPDPRHASTTRTSPTSWCTTSRPATSTARVATRGS